MRVEIDGREIVDWNSFHKFFKTKFGFPDFYGNNMNAWIDCMTDLDEPDTLMMSISVPVNQTLYIDVLHGQELLSENPELAQAIVECSEFVNQRKRDENRSTTIQVNLL